MKRAIKGHRTTEKSRKFCVYTVYKNATDELICLDAEAHEAAEAMGIKFNSFHSTITRTNAGKHKKWTIIRDFYDEMEDEE